MSGLIPQLGGFKVPKFTFWLLGSDDGLGSYTWTGREETGHGRIFSKWHSPKEFKFYRPPHRTLHAVRAIGMLSPSPQSAVVGVQETITTSAACTESLLLTQVFRAMPRGMAKTRWRHKVLRI